MTWFWTVLGAALVAAALRDIFTTLWHPRGFGVLTRSIFRGTWTLAKPLPWLRSSELGGPLALVATAVAWTALVVAGFALVYLPHMPAGYYFGSSLQPQESSDVLASFYLSLTAVATLGLGDILPAEPALRIVVPVQALVGFILLTAVISWVLQLYPALARRRALARRLTTMRALRSAALVESAEASVAFDMLDGVREGLATVEADLTQHGESYFFRERLPGLSLAAGLPYVHVLVTSGRRSTAPEVRHAADLLDHGLVQLCALLEREFLPGEQRDVPAAFARDHGHERAAQED